MKSRNKSTKTKVTGQPVKSTRSGGKPKSKTSGKSTPADGTEFRNVKTIGKHSKTRVVANDTLEIIEAPKTKVRGLKVKLSNGKAALDNVISNSKSKAAKANTTAQQIDSKKSHGKAAPYQHPIFTSQVLRTLMKFSQEYCADYNIDTIFDNALMYGFRCGLNVYKDGKAIDNQDNWTVIGRKRVIALRDALKATASIAKTLKKGIVTANRIHQSEFADLWEQCEAGDKMLNDVFEISMFYRHLLPNESHGQAAWILADQANLLQAAWEIMHSTSYAIKAINDKKTAANVQRFNEAFPHLNVPVATNKKKFLINFDSYNTEKVVWIDFEDECGTNYYPYELSDVTGYFMLSEVKSISNVEQSETLSASKD